MQTGEHHDGEYIDEATVFSRCTSHSVGQVRRSIASDNSFTLYVSPAKYVLDSTSLPTVWPRSLLRSGGYVFAIASFCVSVCRSECNESDGFFRPSVVNSVRNHPDTCAVPRCSVIGNNRGPSGTGRAWACFDSHGKKSGRICE